MLDDAERGRLLVDPARENPAPALVACLNVKLQERSGQLLGLPGRRRLARAQTDDGVADPQRLARLHLEVRGNAVALVEETDHGFALSHRRGALGIHRQLRRSLRDPHRRGARLALRLRIGGRRVLVARGKQQQSCQAAPRPHGAGTFSAAGVPSGGGALAPPRPFITPPMRLIMSIAPWVSTMTSPSLSGSAAPPGMSAM